MPQFFIVLLDFFRNLLGVKPTELPRRVAAGVTPQARVNDCTVRSLQRHVHTYIEWGGKGGGWYKPLLGFLDFVGRDNLSGRLLGKQPANTHPHIVAVLPELIDLPLELDLIGAVHVTTVD